MLGLKKFIIVLAIAAVLLTTVFIMVGPALADGTQPDGSKSHSGTNGDGVQAQDQQAQTESTTQEVVDSNAKGTTDEGIATTTAEEPQAEKNQEDQQQETPALTDTYKGDSSETQSDQSQLKIDEPGTTVAPDSNSDDQVKSEAQPEGQSTGDQTTEEKKPCSIHGLVFNDANGDGACDEGESGMEGVTVWDGDKNVRTDGDGRFSFGGDDPGEHVLREEVPEGMHCNGDVERRIRFDSGDQEVDFGNCHNDETDSDQQCRKHKASVCGIKFEDKNGNGLRDRGEEGIAGITVTAGDQSVVTDENGSFRFDGCEPGEITVHEECPEGWHCTTGESVNLKLEPGEEREVEFGNQKEENGSICGYKFEDSNGNGVFDTGEHGIADVRIMLWWFWGHREVMTDANGYYCFEDLAPAFYKVEVDESTAPPGMTPTTTIWELVWLASGQDVMNVNFGNMMPPQPTGTITGNKFKDISGDGVYHQGDPPLGGFQFTVAEKSNPNAVLATATSAGNGTFAFNNLPPGTYIVEEVPLPANSDYYQTGQTQWEVTISAGETTKPVTFLNALHCSISGTKYIDNGDGQINGNEATLPGVPITLTGTTLRGKTIAPVTVSTDANGNYSFTGLEAGHYTVTESPPNTMTPIIGPSLTADPVPGQDLTGINFLNSENVVVSPAGPITPETPTSVEPIGLGNLSPLPSAIESLSTGTLPETGINQLLLLFIAASLMLGGILLLVLGVLRRGKLT